MRVDCRALWPEDNPTAALLHWSFLAGKLGASPELDRPFLIAARGVKPNGAESHPLVHVPEYDDCGILLCRGEYPVVFPLGTHSYQATSKASPDVDGDGLGDTASIRTGRYLLKDLKNGAEVLFHVLNPDGTGRVPAWRDYDHDRQLEEEEKQKSEALRTGAQVDARGTWASYVLLHGGLDSPPSAKHRYSVACFTCSPKWRELMAEKAKPHGLIDMVVQNAWDLLPLLSGKPATDAIDRLREADTDAPPPPENVA